MVAINNDGASSCAGCPMAAALHSGGKLMFKSVEPVGGPAQVPVHRGMRSEEMLRLAGEIVAGKISRAEIEETWPGPLAAAVLQLAHEIGIAARRESRATAQVVMVIAGAALMAGLIAATITAILKGFGS